MNKKLNDAMNSLSELIVSLQNSRDYADTFSEDEKEVLNVADAAYDLLARTKMVSSIMSKNPDEEERDLHPEVQTFAPTSNKTLDEIFEKISK